MPLEGISNPGPLIPNAKLAETHSISAFQNRVEHNERIKETDDDGEPAAQYKEDESDEEEKAYEEDLSGVATALSNLSGEKVKNIEYTLKFNKYTELVELVDLNTGNLIQSVPANALIDLISDLQYSSGLFVDNEI